MLVRVAEESFDKGLEAMDKGHRDEALAFFEAAIALEKQFGSGSPQPRYLSHYGMCLGLLGRRRYEGVRFCREAVAKEGYNPDLLWNLGRALLAADRRGEAYAALTKGLRLQRDHRGIILELKNMGIRRKPFMRFLGRANPLNVFIGRLRSSST
jgi:tetratricopeptide (TPR) repeat protein